MTQKTLKLLAPAKLNLFLHITGRRADGYHQLQTLFQLLDYGDQMEFELADAGTISLHTTADSLPMPMDDNLIIQAARRLASQTGGKIAGARITINKQIPIGAGLGGGSSNAAITLLALNRLWQLGLGTELLCDIGLELGADVPVFIRGKSAWAEGIGEQLQSMDIANCWYLVVTPLCSVSTAKIFSHEQLTRNTPTIKMADFLEGWSRNDCEIVTRALYPQVGEAMDWLAKFGDTRMTGTGSSVFASFPDEGAADKVCQQLPSKLRGFVARGINSLEQSITEA
mgnify:CR=1 FL=1